MYIPFFEYKPNRAVPAGFNLTDDCISWLRQETIALKFENWKILNGATLITQWGNFDHYLFSSFSSRVISLKLLEAPGRFKRKYKHLDWQWWIFMRSHCNFWRKWRQRDRFWRQSWNSTRNWRHSVTLYDISQDFFDCEFNFKIGKYLSRYPKNLFK